MADKVMNDLQLVSVELIEMKANSYKRLKEDARRIEKELVKDLTLLDRMAFGGLTWNEFMASIDEEVVVNEKVKIKRESYHVDGTYQIEDDIELKVFGNIYYKDTRFRTMIHYKESGRYLESSIPKKYQKQYDELVKEIQKYQFERPSDKYAKDLGITYHF